MVDNKTIFAQSREYYAKLKELNKDVLDLIKHHVDVNPFINLTPIFNDYEKNFYNLNKMLKSKEKNVNAKEKEVKKAISTTTTLATATLTSPTTPSIFTSGFKFDLNGASGSITETSVLGSNKDNKDFAFNNNSATSTSSCEKGTSQQDKLPKSDFASVVEEEHIYSIHCNVYIGKDGEFKNRGEGNLYLKPILKSNKIQLIVRADTNDSLDNLLCNFILSSDIPMNIFKDQYVRVTVLPTPDGEPSHIKEVLFRVESAEKAVELLKTLKKHQRKIISRHSLVKGNIYSIDCRVFVKQLGKCGGRRGKLYLKPISKSGKVRLLVRSDSSSGNILCNFILSSATPMQRKGYSYVQVINLPTPDSKPPPVPVYFQVESPEKADELFKILKKYSNTNGNPVFAVSPRGMNPSSHEPQAAMTTSGKKNWTVTGI